MVKNITLYVIYDFLNFLDLKITYIYIVFHKNGCNLDIKCWVTKSEGTDPWSFEQMGRCGAEMGIIVAPLGG